MPSADSRRLVLAGVVAALFALWAWGVAFREPYPAPTFPRFASIPTDDEIESRTTRLLAFEAGDRRETLRPSEAFNGAFDSFYNDMLNSLAEATAEETEQDPEFVEWAQRRALAGLGWECVEALELVSVSTDGSAPDESLNRFEFGACS